jgi:hypothetical protein
MRPMLVVMAGVNAKHVLELAAAEDEQAVEALATDAADPAQRSDARGTLANTGPGDGYAEPRRPNECARPFPRWEGSGRRFSDTLMADRPPRSANGSSSKRGITCKGA